MARLWKEPVGRELTRIAQEPEVLEWPQLKLRLATAAFDPKVLDHNHTEILDMYLRNLKLVRGQATFSPMVGSGQDTRLPQVPHPPSTQYQSPFQIPSSSTPSQSPSVMEGSIRLAEGTDPPLRVNFVTGSLESESFIGAHIVQKYRERLGREIWDDSIEAVCCFDINPGRTHKVKFRVKESENWDVSLGRCWNTPDVLRNSSMETDKKGESSPRVVDSDDSVSIYELLKEVKVMNQLQRAKLETDILRAKRKYQKQSPGNFDTDPEYMPFETLPDDSQLPSAAESEPLWPLSKHQEIYRQSTRPRTAPRIENGQRQAVWCLAEDDNTLQPTRDEPATRVRNVQATLGSKSDNIPCYTPQTRNQAKSHHTKIHQTAPKARAMTRETATTQGSSSHNNVHLFSSQEMQYNSQNRLGIITSVENQMAESSTSPSRHDTGGQLLTILRSKDETPSNATEFENLSLISVQTAVSGKARSRMEPTHESVFDEHFQPTSHPRPVQSMARYARGYSNVSITHNRAPSSMGRKSDASVQTNYSGNIFDDDEPVDSEISSTSSYSDSNRPSFDECFGDES